MVFECELAVKLHSKDVEVGTSVNGNPRQDQVTTGMVHCPGSTNDKSLSFVKIQHHAPVTAVSDQGKGPVAWGGLEFSQRLPLCVS